LSGRPAAGSDAGEILLVSTETLETPEISKEVRDALLKAARLRKGREGGDTKKAPGVI